MAAKKGPAKSLEAFDQKFTNDQIPELSKATFHELACIAESVYDNIEKAQIPAVSISSRTKNNIVFDESLGVWKYGKDQMQRSAKSLDGAYMLLRTMHTVDFIKQMMATKKSVKVEVTEGVLNEIAELMKKKQDLAAKVKEIDAALKPMVEAAAKKFDGTARRTTSGQDLFFEVVKRTAPKYKEICFELADPQKIAELVDSDDDKFVTHTTSFQAHFPKAEDGKEQE